jgi:hypothetical protein
MTCLCFIRFSFTGLLFKVYLREKPGTKFQVIMLLARVTSLCQISEPRDFKKLRDKGQLLSLPSLCVKEFSKWCRKVSSCM